jgi:hypothetical protein
MVKKCKSRKILGKTRAEIQKINNLTFQTPKKAPEIQNPEIPEISSPNPNLRNLEREK